MATGPARIATRTLRRHLWRYAAIVALVQGAIVVVAMPLLALLFDAVLATVDDGALNLDTLGSVVRSPETVALLVVFSAVAVVFVYVELAVLTLCAHRHLDGDPVTLPVIARDLGRTSRKLLGPAALLFVAYCVFLLPLTNLGVTSILTQDVAVPKFISGELTKTTGGTVLWWGLSAVLAYVVLRLALTLTFFLGTDVSLWTAMRRSLAGTGWLPWRPALAFGAVAAAVVAGLLVATGVAAMLTFVPTTVLGARSLWWPAASLAVVQLAHFTLLGLAIAWYQLYLVAWQRQLDREPQVPLARLPARVRGLIATGFGLVTLAALVGLTVVNVADLRFVQDPGRTTIVGHRGYTSGGVENSVEALEAAARAGADMVEMDVLETKDQQLVVMHDVNLERLTGRDVDVYDEDLATLERMTIRQGDFSSTIPGFAAYAERAEALGIRLLVELKPHGHEAPGYARRVAATFDELGLPADWRIQSLDKDLVEEVDRIDPDLVVGYVVPFNVGRLPSTSADFVVVEDWSYSDRLAREGRDADRPVWVWTVNSPTDIRTYLHRGVAGLITDRVGVAVTDRTIARGLTSPLRLLLDGVLRDLT